MPEAMVSIRGMERHYVMSSETIKALDGINLDVHEGERIILLGPSGSGKTTLLNCISALDSPTDGSYNFGGTPVPRHDSEAMTTFRRENIGYVFQFFNLLQDLTVLENILLIQELAGGRDEARARQLLNLVGLEAEVNRFPAEISGGQQQRVAIARSLVANPNVVLADEPTGALDTKTGSEIMGILNNLNKESKMTVLIVTHEPHIAEQTNRIISFRDGEIINDKNNQK